MSAKITIPTQFTAIDKLSKIVKKMTKNVKGFSKKGIASISRFDSRVTKSFDKLGSLGKLALGMGLGTLFMGAISSANDFEASMSNVATLIDTSVEDIGKMGDEVLKLATTIPKPVDELTESLYSIRSAGISANDAMSTLENAGKLAVAGLSTTAESTDILTSAMNAFASEGLTTNQISNMLFKTVKAGKTDISQLSQAFGANAGIIQSAGVKLADFQAATAALTTTGTPAAQVQNQLRSAIVKLKKPTSEMTKIFKALGVTSDKELIKKFGTLGGAFKAIDSQAGKMNINMAKAWGSSEALAASTSLLGAQSGAYKSTLKDMTNGVDSLEEAFGKQSKTGASAAQLAKNNIETLSITFGNLLVPVLNQVIKLFVPLIQSFTSFVKGNTAIIKVLGGVVIAFGLMKAVLIGAKIYTVAYNVVLGISTALTQNNKRALIGNVIAQNAYRVSMVAGKIVMLAGTVATAGFTAAQWLLNIALNANPIGLIIIGIVALVAVVVTIIKYYDQWGASLTLLLGPFGMIINVIQSFRRNWDMVKKAFSEGGMIAGLKAIGRVLLDALLMPLEQLLNLLSNIPGLGGLASKGANMIAELRGKLGVETGEEKEKEALPNTKQASNAEIINRSERTNKLKIDINDKGNNVSKVTQDSGEDIPVNLGGTIGAF